MDKPVDKPWKNGGYPPESGQSGAGASHCLRWAPLRHPSGSLSQIAAPGLGSDPPATQGALTPQASIALHVHRNQRQEPIHVALQEFLRTFVVDRAVGIDQAVLEMNERLGLTEHVHV